MNIKNKDFIFNEFGVSGREDKIKEKLKDFIKPYVDEILEDRNNSLIGLKKGTKKENKLKIMLSAHYDTIGLIVTYITKEGFLRFADVGWLPPYQIITKRVIFENGLSGIIYADEQENIKKGEKNKYFIDIGAKSEDEAKKMIKIGDMGAIYTPYIIQNNNIFSSWLDDRIGCFVLLEIMENLKNPLHDIYFVFSSQEEVGLRGARTSAFKIEPDIGLAFDVTGADDLIKKHNFYNSKLGEGAAIKIMDNSVISNKKLVNLLEKLAIENKIKYQMDILMGGGTDAGVIQLTKSGVITGGISIPTRYLHSANEMCNLDDVQACIDLGLTFCKNEINI
ncbi:MAG: M20/M25/M40 family metallo-hydrolase [Spirochaetes bacterium]|nr:M20/M25/M40 family metallo-hydrolase [Spirochaetota bacterium]